MEARYVEIVEDTCKLMNEMLGKVKCSPGQVFVLGGSTSEIVGAALGTKTSLEVGKVVLQEVVRMVRSMKMHLAVQGCEHINRALVVEEDCALVHDWEIVRVVPHLSAGGGLATAAWELFNRPVVIERIQAHMGLDIGETMIGMHLRPVVVPLRLEIRYVGKARINAATTRHKLIGGERARY